MAIKQEVIVEALDRAVRDVFGTMLAMEARRDAVVVEPVSDEPVEGVLALLGLTGAWVGTGALYSDANSGRKLAAGLLGEEPTSLDQDALDAVGEIGNMVIGNFKDSLEGEVGPLSMSVPSVVHGKNFAAHSVGFNEWTVVRFSFDGGTVAFKVCLHPKTD